METEGYELYEEASWDAWDEILTAHLNRMSRDDFGAYLPSPGEIAERKEMLRWLQDNDFSHKFIEAIMHWDHPGYGLVRRVVMRWGLIRGKEILEDFLPNVSFESERGL